MTIWALVAEGGLAVHLDLLSCTPLSTSIGTTVWGSTLKPTSLKISSSIVAPVVNEPLSRIRTSDPRVYDDRSTRQMKRVTNPRVKKQDKKIWSEITHNYYDPLRVTCTQGPFQREIWGSVHQV